MQTPKATQAQYHQELGGLKSLPLYPNEEGEDQEKESPPLDSSWTMYSPSSSSLIGDCIGMESCVDFRNDEEIRKATDDYELRRSLRDQRLEEEKKSNRSIKKNEFPPPIPWLARTGNLPSHMPWVFRRYYTGDGRLVIREEKVRRHEYFRAHRSNGRLTLHLVPLNDDVLDHHVVGDIEEDGYGEADSDVEDEDNDDDDGTVGVEESTVMGVSMESNGINGEGGKRGGKCIEYKSKRSRTSCIFGMQVPVHSI